VHSLKQKDYLLWKKEKLSIFETKSWQYHTFDNRTQKEYHFIGFHTKANEFLTDLYNDFYPSAKNKVLSKKYLQELDPLGLAIWYMDDGGYNYDHRTPYFALGGFSPKERNSIKEYFKEKWNFDTTLYRNTKTNCDIYINKECSDSFLSLIKPFVHSSLVYKLGHMSDNNLEKLESVRKRQCLTSKNYRQSHKQYYKKYHKVYDGVYYQKNKKEKARHNKEYYQRKKKELNEEMN
jgi:hypothetical protein